MKTENLTEFSDQEFLQKLKKVKNNKIIDATIIGFTIGIAIDGAVKIGFDFFYFLPLDISIYSS